jgi:hypothetical protein
MRATLFQGPEGSPNFCFGVYRSLNQARLEAKEHGVPNAMRKSDAELREEGFDTCLEFVQSDWDYAPLASRLGWVPCECGCTDGTVDCKHKTASTMLGEAFDYLSARDGELFDCVD